MNEADHKEYAQRVTYWLMKRMLSIKHAEHDLIKLATAAISGDATPEDVVVQYRDIEDKLEREAMPRAVPTWDHASVHAFYRLLYRRTFFGDGTDVEVNRWLRKVRQREDARRKKERDR